MTWPEAGDTIAAISTPPGEAGIGIVRLSGPQAEPIARRLFGDVTPEDRPNRIGPIVGRQPALVAQRCLQGRMDLDTPAFPPRYGQGKDRKSVV